MTEGAIFDMDGVLVDNLKHHLRAWKALGKELGKELTDRQVKAVFGQRNREMLPKLMGCSLGEEEIRQYSSRKETLYREFVAPELKPVPGLIDFLRSLKEESFTIAVATSGPRENLDLVLDGLEIRAYFDAIVLGAEVPRSKPHPDIFLVASDKLKLPPEKCVVFEDSSSGIEAARRAGCRCVGVATTHDPDELKKFSPDLIVSNFIDLSAAQIR